jgi:hypothetical protein
MDTASNYAELIRLVNPSVFGVGADGHHQWAWNLTGLGQTQRLCPKTRRLHTTAMKPTTEARRRPAYVGIDEIVAWAILNTKLIEWCCIATHEEYQACNDESHPDSQPRVTFTDLMARIGLEANVVEHYVDKVFSTQDNQSGEAMLSSKNVNDPPISKPTIELSRLVLVRIATGRSFSFDG